MAGHSFLTINELITYLKLTDFVLNGSIVYQI